MKKIIFVFTVAFALFIIDGCGPSKNSTSGTTSGTTDSTQSMGTDTTQHK